MPAGFVLLLKMLFHHETGTGLVISMLNGYRDIENAFKFAVIKLKKLVLNVNEELSPSS